MRKGGNPDIKLKSPFVGNPQYASEMGKKNRGKKKKKTILWEKLGEFITNEGAELFTENLKMLMSSESMQDVVRGMIMYKDVVEFFKPRLSRTELVDTEPQTLIIEHQEVKVKDNERK